ncbi:MAG: hypothetical protein KAI17_09430 [Thiotrichaceae bacterium]|nr:hypothetical protein [Thiotrichaceae bacterium]
MNILHSKNLGKIDGFELIFEAVQPTHYPSGISKGIAESLVSNSLVCFTPHLSAMKNGYIVVMLQCDPEIMTDYDKYYSRPEFNALIQQVVIEAQMTMGS